MSFVEKNKRVFNSLDVKGNIEVGGKLKGNQTVEGNQTVDGKATLSGGIAAVLTEYADNAAALADDLVAGDLYVDGTTKAVTIVVAAA